MFNFGADEYANDVFTTPGWGELQKTDSTETSSIMQTRLHKSLKMQA